MKVYLKQQEAYEAWQLPMDMDLYAPRIQRDLSGSKGDWFLWNEHSAFIVSDEEFRAKYEEAEPSNTAKPLDGVFAERIRDAIDAARKYREANRPAADPRKPYPPWKPYPYDIYYTTIEHKEPKIF